MDLFTSNSQQVTSFSMIKADLGTDGWQLLVLSGIARPEWLVNDDGNLYQMTFVVHQGVFASNLGQANAMVGLASIHNDDSAFTFAVDEATVTLDPAGELLLNVHGALMGSTTVLSRFSYQIVATLVSVTSRISGEVTWLPTTWAPPSLDPGVVGAQLGIVANQFQLIPAPPPPAPSSFGTVQLTPLVNGYVTSVAETAGSYVAQYEIDNVPLGQQLQVSVALGNVFGGSTAVHVDGPSVFTLTASAASQDGENFYVEGPAK